MAEGTETNGSAAETKPTGKTATTKRSSSAKRSAATRRNNNAPAAKRSAAAKKAAQTRSEKSKTPVEHVTAYLERLIASPTETARSTRAALVSGVEELRGSLSSPDKLARDLAAARRKDAERLAARLEPVVQRGVATGTKVAASVQSRIPTLR